MEFIVRLAVVDKLWGALLELCGPEDPPDSALEGLEELLNHLPLEAQVNLIELARHLVLSSAPLLDVSLFAEGEAGGSDPLVGGDGAYYSGAVGVTRTTPSSRAGVS